jgi:hypothetical protein
VKQLGLAFAQYIGDYGDTLPPVRYLDAKISWDDLFGMGGYDGTSPMSLAEAMEFKRPDGKLNKVYRCPSDSGQNWIYARSYTVNNGATSGGDHVGCFERGDATPGERPVFYKTNKVAPDTFIMGEMYSHEPESYNYQGNVSDCSAIRFPKAQLLTLPPFFSYHSSTVNWLHLDGRVANYKWSSTFGKGGSPDSAMGYFCMSLADRQ